MKISDGALTPDLYPDLYHKVYGVKRPVRWSALETLTQGICGSKSNVVSIDQMYICVHTYVRMYVCVFCNLRTMLFIIRTCIRMYVNMYTCTV